jgi:S-DNA-T family DNA segregation ATPase FtsK/SpoIIIE
MPEKKDAGGGPADSPFFSNFIVKIVLGVVALLAFLSLISYHPDDTALLDGGLSSLTPVHNWIGLLGAWISGNLIAWVGYAAYPFTLAFLICIGSRLAAPEIRSIRSMYLVGLGFAVVGCSMLLGIFPGFLEGVSGKLNIAETPGGVIGQRFCSPVTATGGGGWLTFVVNKTGAAIISLAVMSTGLVAMWYYDWRESLQVWYGRALLIWQEHREATAEDREAAKAEADADRQKRREERDKKREEQRQLREEKKRQKEAQKEAEKEHKTVVPEPVLKPVAAPEPEPAPAVPIAIPAAGADSMAVPETNDKPKKRRSHGKFKLPPLSMLNEMDDKGGIVDPRELDAKRRVLQETLDSFGIDATVGDITSGPRVALFEIKPAPGVKVEKISSLQNNIAMSMKAESLRILTPIPGKDSVGIEVPNSVSQAVAFRALLESPNWKNSKAKLPIMLGKDIEGKPIILDLARAPHLLIAGATGSGKSVCMNTLILSLLYRFTPDELKLIMVDPKVVEFAGYKTLPHLVSPVLSDIKKVPIALHWAVKQMEWRYEILAKVGVRNLESFNARDPDPPGTVDDEGNPIPARLPFLVIIIDELAEIMMAAKSDVEGSLARIAQLARAVGIHAVIATQRPSVNVVTGVIKANFPTRIAFQVSSVVDSRTIIDAKGADLLLGRGDMLFKAPGGSKLARVQGALVEDEEIDRVVTFLADQGDQEFVEDMFVSASAIAGDGSGGAGSDLSDKDEELVQQAIEVIIRDRRATTSYVQRSLRIGYNRAALIMEILEERGVIGPQIGSSLREILIDGDAGGGETAETAEAVADNG